MSTPETAVEPISERCARGPVELAPEAIADEEGRPGSALSQLIAARPGGSPRILVPTLPPTAMAPP